jgi:cell shape-determining protein MreC
MKEHLNHIGYITEATLKSLQKRGRDLCLIYRTNPTTKDIPAYANCQQMLNRISELEDENKLLRERLDAQAKVILTQGS